MFVPESVNKLHDGAVVIRNLRVAKAGVFFPMPDTKVLDAQLGSRHRAALGITEETDAVVVVVSEERGSISFCFNGNIVTNLDGASLRQALLGLFGQKARKRTGKPAGKRTGTVTQTGTGSFKVSLPEGTGSHVAPPPRGEPALCHAAVLLTHTVIGQWASEAIFLLVLPPAIGDWARGRRFRALAPFLAIGGAFGLAAVYVLPALAEKGFSHFERVVGGYYTAAGHTVPISSCSSSTSTTSPATSRPRACPSLSGCPWRWACSSRWPACSCPAVAGPCGCCSPGCWARWSSFT